MITVSRVWCGTLQVKSSILSTQKKGFKTIVQFLKNLTTPLVADKNFFCEENDINTNRLLKTFQIAPNCHSGQAPSF